MGVVTTRDLEANAAKPIKPDCLSCSDDDPTVEDNPAYVDLMDGRALLYRGMRLLAFIGDKELCKRVTKKERKILQEVATSFKTHLDETSGEYGDEEWYENAL